MPIIDINMFIPSVIAVISTTEVSHKVSRGSLRGVPDKVWIKKEMPDPAIAMSELLAQEFFRLLIPHQPETRLARNNRLNTHFILSEEVRGYRKLPYNKADKFANGEYKGLGQVMLCSMFLQEVDLKNGNVGLDKHRRVIKIDGDWCFAEGYSKRITTASIDSLPYPKDFSAFNWLDLIQMRKNFASSSIVNPKLSQSVQFRSEVNEAMLKICLLPDAFIDQFVNAYMPAGGERFANLIKTRRIELRLSALQNPSFQIYLNTPQAVTDATDITHQMMQFKIGGKPLITGDKSVVLMTDVCAMSMQLVTRTTKCASLLSYLYTIQKTLAFAFDIDRSLLAPAARVETRATGITKEEIPETRKTNMYREAIKAVKAVEDSSKDVPKI